MVYVKMTKASKYTLLSFSPPPYSVTGVTQPARGWVEIRAPRPRRAEIGKACIQILFVGYTKGDNKMRAQKHGTFVTQSRYHNKRISNDPKLSRKNNRRVAVIPYSTDCNLRRFMSNINPSYAPS